MMSNPISRGSADPATTQRMASVLCGDIPDMERSVYMRREWRDRLPREVCVVELLFGGAVGECAGLIHRHHVDPEDPDSRTIEVCNSHHQRLHAALRVLRGPEKAWRTCPHRPGTHRYPGAKEACEARLNRNLDLTSDAA